MRVNFGKTRPLEEVGVRKKLRRKLQLSPNLEEIQFKMARDKGYSGHSQRKMEDLSIIMEVKEV